MQPVELLNALPASSPQRATTVHRRRKVVLYALALIAAGSLLHFSIFNQLWMRALHAQGLGQDTFWLLLTNLGRGWPAFAVIAALDLGSGRRTALFFRCTLLSALLLPVAKDFFAVARPASVLPPDVLHLIGVPVTGFSSMPSGHALTAGAVLGILWLGHRVSLPKRRFQLALLVGGLIALLVTCSRMAVGAHWPADVMVGTGVGMLIAAAADWHEQRQPWAARLSRGTWAKAVLALQFISAGILFWSAAENALETVPNLLLGLGALALAMLSLRRHRQHSALKGLPETSLD